MEVMSDISNNMESAIRQGSGGPDRTVAPEISGFTTLNLPEMTESVLPNGVIVRYLDSGEEDVSRISVMWNVGPADVDSPAALSCMTQMLLEGSGELSGEDVSGRLESAGAWFNCFTMRHALVMSLHQLNHTAPEVLHLFLKIMTSPSFPEEALESIRRKEASAKEIELRKPSRQADILAREVVYGKDHPLARVVRPEDILAVSREELIRLHSGIVLASPPVIYVSGRIEKSLLDMISGGFGEIDFGLFADRKISLKYVAVPKLHASEVCRKKMPESMQTGFRMQIPSIPRSHIDFETLRFAVILLGGYFGSRLSSNIREDKGYTYGISAQIVSENDSSDIIIMCECDNRYTDGVLAETDREIRRLAAEPPSDEEMATVSNVVMSALAGTLDSPFKVSSYCEYAYAIGETSDAFRRQVEATRSVTAEDVSRVTAKYILDAPRVVALAGGDAAEMPEESPEE